MTAALSFSVPGEVRGKGRPRIVKIGQFSRLAADKQTVNYENLVAMMASEAMERAGMGEQHFQCPLEVSVVAAFVPPASASKKAREQMLRGELPPAKKPDLDNIVKILDALNGIVWRDDAQIVKLSAHKLYAERPCLQIHIQPYRPPFDVI